MTALLVALGAGAGSVVRYLLAHLLDRPWHPGTLAANAAGSLLLGACVGWSLDGSALALAGAGFSGGLSTYSSLAVQARDLGPLRGTAYAIVTVALGLGACTLGYLLAGS